MKLNKEQIEDLYAFTRNHYVEYYDLQTELVDHLANDIEVMWEHQPKLSFEEAKQKAFKKFGVCGFMEPIEKKQKAMNKRYLRFLWHELKKWFEIPQVVITILIFFSFFLAFSSNYVSTFAVVFYGLILLWSIYKQIVLNRQFRRRKEVSNKKWLLEEMIFKQANISTLLFVTQIYNVLNISDIFIDGVNNTYASSVLSAGFTMLILIMYISFEVIPKKAEKLLEKTYPEYKIV